MLKPSKEGDLDLASMYVSTRHLYDATARLAEATDRLAELAGAGRLSKAEEERLRQLLSDVRSAAESIESSRKSLRRRIERIRAPDHKGGGRRFERSRESAPEYPGLDELRRRER